MPSNVHGLLYAIAAYASWGLFPLYFRALHAVPPLELLAHRVVWSLVLLVIWTSVRGRWSDVRKALTPRARWAMAASSLLIACNWLVYIGAVHAHRVLEASLGYFINPLVSVLLGMVFLRERLSTKQTVAIGIAAVGVLLLVVWLRVVPWISVTLALSFGLYGLVRKRAGVEAVPGLLAETALLMPPSAALIVYRLHQGSGAFGHDARTTVLLLAAGPITAITLVWFAEGVRRLPLSAVGILQYLAPTGQFAVAVLAFGETLTRAHEIAFACIWLGLIVYSWDAWQRRQRA